LMDRSAPEGPLRDAAEGERDWHDVNPRVRDRILQSRQEGFPAGYDDVLKDYYRAMAEQDVSAEPFASLEAPEEE